MLAPRSGDLRLNVPAEYTLTCLACGAAVAFARADWPLGTRARWPRCCGEAMVLHVPRLLSDPDAAGGPVR